VGTDRPRLAHYEACDGLELPVDQQVANGRSTFDKTSGTLMGTIIRMAKEAGVHAVEGGPALPALLGARLRRRRDGDLEDGPEGGAMDMPAWP